MALQGALREGETRVARHRQSVALRFRASRLPSEETPSLDAMGHACAFALCCGGAVLEAEGNERKGLGRDVDSRRLRHRRR